MPVTDSSSEKTSLNLGRCGASDAKFAGQCGSCLTREDDGACRHLWDSTFTVDQMFAIRDGILKCPLHSPSSQGVARKEQT